MSTPIRPVVVVPKRTTYAPHLLAIALLWALAMTLDYHDQAAQANERVARIDAEFTECLRGEWRATTAEGAQLGCLPVEVFHPSQTSTNYRKEK